MGAVYSSSNLLTSSSWRIDFLHFLLKVGPVPRTGLPSRLWRDEGIGPYRCCCVKSLEGPEIIVIPDLFGQFLVNFS